MKVSPEQMPAICQIPSGIFCAASRFGCAAGARTAFKLCEDVKIMVVSGKGVKWKTGLPIPHEAKADYIDAIASVDCVTIRRAKDYCVVKPATAPIDTN